MGRSETEPTSAYTVADQIRYWLVEERRRLLAAMAGLTEDDTREPVARGGWSPHDILAHRLFWEEREAEALRQLLLGKPVELLAFPLARVDGTNATAVQLLRGHSTVQIMRAIERARAKLMELVAKVPDAELSEGGNAARTLLGIALEHDREHTREIEDWRRRRGRSSRDNPSLAPNAGPLE